MKELDLQALAAEHDRVLKLYGSAAIVVDGGEVKVMPRPALDRLVKERTPPSMEEVLSMLEQPQFSPQVMRYVSHMPQRNRRERRAAERAARSKR